MRRGRSGWAGGQRGSVSLRRGRMSGFLFRGLRGTWPWPGPGPGSDRVGCGGGAWLGRGRHRPAGVVGGTYIGYMSPPSSFPEKITQEQLLAGCLAGESRVWMNVYQSLHPDQDFGIFSLFAPSSRRTELTSHLAWETHPVQRAPRLRRRCSGLNRASGRPGQPIRPRFIPDDIQQRSASTQVAMGYPERTHARTMEPQLRLGGQRKCEPMTDQR